MKFNQLKYIPIDDRILVKPGPVKYITAIYTVPVEGGPNKGKTIDDVHEVTKEKQRVRTSFRVGQIIEVSLNTGLKEGNEVEFKVGDWVIYRESQATKFDLLAKKDDDPDCPVLLRRYEVVGIVQDINDIKDE